MATKRGQLSRVDLLQAAVEHETESADYIAQQLGLEKRPEQRIIENKVEKHDTLLPVEESGPSSQQLLKPGDRPKTAFWLLHSRESRPHDPDKKPLQPTSNVWQDRPKTKPQHQPLLDKKALLEKVHSCLFQPQKSHKVDVQKIVTTLSQGKHLQQIPRQILKSEQIHLHLIDDRSRHLTSYWQDHHYASLVMIEHYAQAHCSLSVLLDGDSRPQQMTQIGLTDWQVADGSSVVIFSDLGSLKVYPQRTISQWLSLGRELQRKLCQVIVLLPCAVQWLDPRFKALFQLLSWEHSTIAPPLTAQQSQKQVEQLLSALAPSIRIEPSLLRAMRLAMQVHGQQWQLAAAIEAQLWQHEAIQEPHSVAASWTINARQNALQAFECLTDAEKTTALNTIRLWRTTLSEKIWYEEIISLSDHTQQLDCIQVDVEQAQAYFEVLDKTFQNDEELDRVPQTQAWFRRLYQRLPKQYLQASACLQRMTERVYKDQPDFDSQWINQQNLPESTKMIQQAVLYQKGNTLRLQRYQSLNLPSDAYSPLGLIKLRREQVQVLSSNTILGALTLDDTHEIRLPIEPNLTVRSDEETLSLQTQKYLDNLEMGRDRYGLYADIELFGITQRFRYIEAGTFMMGSPSDEPERYDDEDNHQVTLNHGYWLADTACTQALWEAVMEDNPANFDDNPQNPVENVSWLDIQTFLQRLNQHYPELHAQLPSEAQWEYACRAGTITPFSFGENITPEQVNYNGTEPYTDAEKGEYREKTVAARTLPPNPWGLYEMHGNVWEWCLDEWNTNLGTESKQDPVNSSTKPDSDSGVSRVLRGGSWVGDGGDCRSAMRGNGPAGDRRSYYGFRLSLGHELQSDTVSRSEENSLTSRQPEHEPARRGAVQVHDQDGSGFIANLLKRLKK